MEKMKLNFIRPMIFLLFALFSLPLLSQVQCMTGESHDHSRSMEFRHVNTFVRPDNANYCLKIRAYNVRNNSGGDGESTSVINAHMNSISSSFSGTGISFDWDGTIIPINDSDFRYNDYLTFIDGCISADLSSFGNDISDHISNDAIDVFFRNGSGPTFANGIAGSAQILMDGVPAANTDTMAHEIGHVLGLFHTSHGTFGNGDDSNCENKNDGFDDIPECLYGTTLERGSSGDFVHDTKPDPGLNGYTVINGAFGCTANVDQTFFEYCGSGDPYEAPDIDNFMNIVSFYPCRTTFTDGQANRMKYFLNESNPIPSLDVHKAKFTCPVDPEPCDDCNGAQGNANAVFNTLEVDPDCFTHTISMPLLTFDCPDTYRVTWNDLGVTAMLNNPGDDTTVTYTTPGMKSVTIEVFRGDGIKVEYCGAFDYTFEVDGDCNQTQCEDCEELVGDMLSSIEVTLHADCTRYKIDIPDLGTCYGGYIDWGDATSLEPLVSNTTMTHQYVSSGNYEINIVLFEGSAKVCEGTTTVPVACASECPNPCTINADFTYTNSGCLYTFDGENIANTCSNSIYEWEWRINGSVVGNSENLTYDFSGNVGTQTVQLKVRYPDGTQKDCEDYEFQNIFVNCPGPACYDDYGIHFNNEAGGGECATGQAVLTGNLSLVSSVDWEWALGGFSGTGASTGTTSPIYYPSGNWNGFNIAISATINFTDGTSCEGLVELFPMECGQSKSNLDVTISPNPTQGSFTVTPDQDIAIQGIHVRNIYGKLIVSKRSQLDEQINIAHEFTGIYFVEVRFEDGTSTIKKLVLDK
ncbi:MAG: zinc-dependent metalloprotease [Bacteroidota bacterium]